MLRLVCVTAHPDDEAGAFGGTLLLAHERGIETSVVCLTAGTAARNRGTAKTDAQLAELRRGELRDSCKLLGVTRCELLNYQDGQLDRVDFYSALRDLVGCIRRRRPHVVITFGPDGGLTGHLDHAMAGALATQAFEWAGRDDRYSELELPPHRAQKLYYHTADYKLPGRQYTAPPTVTACIDIGVERFEKKIQAFMQHTTQAPLFDRVRKNLGKRPYTEMYHLACTREPRRAGFETDLFEDVVDE